MEEIKKFIRTAPTKVLQDTMGEWEGCEGEGMNKE
jgi:hypothetical protein